MDSRHISQYFARSCNILFNYVHNKITRVIMKKSECHLLDGNCLPIFLLKYYLSSKLLIMSTKV